MNSNLPGYQLTKLPISAILLDIEGTTTPISFVYDVLFPYARVHLRAYLEDPKNSGASQDPLRLIREEVGDAGINTIERLMNDDRKSPGLKLLQGLIWQDGYRRGELRGEVFDDVPPALVRWRSADLVTAIYSSGSVLAQQLLFGTTAHGDLTRLIARFFDTGVGAKTSSESYLRIAAELGYPTERLLFISDVTTELDAAAAAGYRTLLCVRAGNHPQPPHQYQVIRTFDQLHP